MPKLVLPIASLALVLAGATCPPAFGGECPADKFKPRLSPSLYCVRVNFLPPVFTSII